MEDLFNKSGFDELRPTFYDSASAPTNLEAFVVIGGMHYKKIRYKSLAGNDSNTNGARMSDIRKSVFVTTPSYNELGSAVRSVFDANLLKRGTMPDGSGDTVYTLSNKGVRFYRVLYGHVGALCPVSKN